MPISDYLRDLRALVGPRLLVMPGCGALVRDEAGRLLFQRRSDDGCWSLPGGAMDPGERPAETVVREVHEETGLRVEPVELAGVFGGPGFRHTYPNGDQLDAVVLIFECRVVGGHLQSLDGESLELRWCPPAQRPPVRLPYPPGLFTRRLGDPPLFEI
ncbi:MAG: NUDIX domain-containing protein [Fimbriimonadaceae bacterium]|nr:NUDIX domain-containing protein [Fimbriimonadaceae bacterium]